MTNFASLDLNIYLFFRAQKTLLKDDNILKAI